MTTLNAGPLTDIKPGKSKVFESGDHHIALFNVDGKIHAIGNICPHAGGPLGEGELEGKIVTCPWHAWQFDVTTGACVTVPQSRQHCYKARVEKDEILVDIGE